MQPEFSDGSAGAPQPLPASPREECSSRGARVAEPSWAGGQPLQQPQQLSQPPPQDQQQQHRPSNSVHCGYGMPKHDPATSAFEGGYAAQRSAAQGSAGPALGGFLPHAMVHCLGLPWPTQPAKERSVDAGPVGGLSHLGSMPPLENGTGSVFAELARQVFSNAGEASAAQALGRVGGRRESMLQVTGDNAYRSQRGSCALYDGGCFSRSRHAGQVYQDEQRLRSEQSREPIQGCS